MAKPILMPKLGNTVESVIILTWHVAVGDVVEAGAPLCEVETDKAALTVESAESGILLARFYEEGAEVPVLSNIAVVGLAGESVAEFKPQAAPAPAAPPAGASETQADVAGDSQKRIHISPRARQLAQRKGINIAGLPGSGPAGRIIERDIEAAWQAQAKITPVAQAMLDSGDFELADSAARGRVGKQDLVPAPVSAQKERPITEIPLRGPRRTIAARMLQSMQSTAQLTLHRSADARALLSFRRRLKESDAALGLRAVSLNDLLLLAVARTLPLFPALNALFENDIIYQYAAVHLGLAVDTERGLLVPVIGDADRLTLKEISAAAQRLAEACRDGTILPDELRGGTFTVSNLGALGIENFSPILNPPQVALLGVGSINLKAVQAGAEVEFWPHISLSLTINHQVVDGAPAARFLARLAQHLAQIDLLAAT